jgi:hypothetical protein
MELPKRFRYSMGRPGTPCIARRAGLTDWYPFALDVEKPLLLPVVVKPSRHRPTIGLTVLFVKATEAGNQPAHQETIRTLHSDGATQ